MTLSAMAGRQLPFVSLIVPAWLVVTMSGWRGFVGVWPAVLVCGGVFAVVQFAWSNFVGPELVDIVGGLASLGALALLLPRLEAGAKSGRSRRASGRRSAAGRPCRVASGAVGQPPARGAIAAPAMRSLSAPGCRGCSSAWWSSSGACRR